MFSKKTVDSVIGGLSKMITDLEEVQDANLIEVAAQDVIIVTAGVKKVIAKTEAQRADHVATKIQALIE